MRKLVALIGLALASFSLHATNGLPSVPQEKKSTAKGEVIAMTKELFKKEIFDYTVSKMWNYKGHKPVIIDLYAVWCGPCRQVAPIMDQLAKEYAGQVTIYKVNVDKEKELAGVFNATSIPLIVYIPVKGEPQFIRGAADKATFKRAIDEFLLK